MLAFAILYLVKDSKKNSVPMQYNPLYNPLAQPLRICTKCQKQNLPTSSRCESCGVILS
jgi:hypothetical protein